MQVIKRSRTVEVRPPLKNMNAHELKQEIKFLRHRLGYWRDKAEELAYQVQEGVADPTVVKEAITEINKSLERFLEAVNYRNQR
jgi:hypothetical protein